MGKLLWKTAILLLLVLAVPLGTVLSAFLIPAQFDLTYYGQLPRMFDRLRDARGPKLILVGSSGIAFGVNTELLQQELPQYTVCPFGLYGSIGTKAMMDLSRVNIAEGDLVVLLPETGPQTLSLYFNGESLFMATDNRPDMLRWADVHDFGSLMEALPGYLSQKYEIYRSGEKPDPSGVYALSSFDENCNMIYPRPCNIMQGGYAPTDLVSFDPAIVADDFLQYVNEYDRFVRSRGARLVLGFAPVNGGGLAADFEVNTPEKFREHLEAGLSCPIIGTPETYILDKEWFYDSNVHLNTPGSVLYTSLLARDIKAYLGDRSPVTIEIPEKPALPGQEQTAPQEDTGLFTFTDGENGLLISGLTAEGLRQTELTLPQARGDQAIVGITAHALDGADRLRILRLGPNIRSLENGIFRDCVSLEEIYMAPGQEPSRCQVNPGGGLLDGADKAKIYVERSRLNDYIFDYFWSRYAARIFPYGQEPQAPDPVTPPEPVTPDPPLQPEGTTVAYHLESVETDAVSTEIYPRVNTRTAAQVEYRQKGFTLLGWSMSPEGGDIIGLGSRITVAENERTDLWPVWAAWEKAESFAYILIDESETARLCEDFTLPEGLKNESDKKAAVITGYTGTAGSLIIPGELGGFPVKGIAENAFRGAEMTEVTLPDSIVWIGEKAFADCKGLASLRLFDGIERMSATAFDGSPVKTLHMNALTPALYGQEENGQVANKLEMLINRQSSKPKLVLFGGCSLWYGVNAADLQSALHSRYEVYNMGVLGGLCATFQLDLIMPYLNEGDVLVHVPDPTSIYQLLGNDSVDYRFFFSLEQNYDLIAQVDLTRLRSVFPSLGEFFATKTRLIASGAVNEGYFLRMTDCSDHGDLTRYRHPGNPEELDNLPLVESDELMNHSRAKENIPNYYKAIADKGVRVFWASGPIARGRADGQAAAQLQESLGEIIRTTDAPVRVVMTVPQATMEDYFFYDTPYHLSSVGASEYTSLLSEALRSLLK
ncbi:MAG: leucine-rich repeat protein [Oscillospiraceae bacterium]|nr:leucine-rich repeat protein [Oscillospiraceae bacterium]